VMQSVENLMRDDKRCALAHRNAAPGPHLHVRGGLDPA
jgi:hypothetical protein